MKLEETLECLRLWREKGDADALLKLINANTRLIGSIAKKYVYTGVAMEELMSIGKEGLLLAINKFNYNEKGNIKAFTTYIYLAIERKICEEVNKYITRVNKETSIDAPVGYNENGEPYTLLDTLGTDDEIVPIKVINTIEIKEVACWFQKLNQREKEIIILVYIRNYRISEIAKMSNCSRQNISRIERRAIGKLRECSA